MWWSINSRQFQGAAGCACAILLRCTWVEDGPSRHFAATQQTVADEPTADIALPSESRIYQPGVGTTPSFFCRLDDDVVY
jgi:hypothetical protein